MLSVGLPNNEAWRMPVLDSNTCLGMISLGIVGWARSAIVTAGAIEQRNWGRDAMALGPCAGGVVGAEDVDIDEAW